MFTLLLGHRPLYRSGQRKAGRLFTPAVTAAFIVLLVILLACIFAPLLAPYDPNAGDLSNTLAMPSAGHPFGTDQNGRDLFSRILYGGRTALTSALGVVAISMILGIPLGLTSGYRGGLFDTLTMRCCDILLSFQLRL